MREEQRHALARLAERDDRSVSWVVGCEEPVVSVKWHEGEFKPARQGTMGSREHEEPRWFGSKVLDEPGH